MTTDSNDPVAGTAANDIRFLQEHLGLPFINWILNDPVPPFSQAQAEVAAILVKALQADGPVTPGAFARKRLKPLVEFDEAYGTSRLNYFRRIIVEPCETTVHAGIDGDNVLAALRQAASAMYGELLLETDSPLAAKSGSVGAPEITALENAILNDPAMPFAEAERNKVFVRFHSSTGNGGGVFPGMVGPSIIFAAWQLECLKDPAPSLAALLSTLPEVLDNARRALGKRKARAKAVVSLTGLLLPPDTTLQLLWGRIRPARPEDHPSIIKLLQKQLPSTRLETGEELSITDGGDVIVEADVPLRYSGPQPAAPPEIAWPPQISVTAMDQYVTQARVGLLLALRREPPPVVYASWSWFIEPISMLGSIGRSDSDGFAHRTATLLTTDEAVAWMEWTKLLDGLDLPRLGVGPTRLLRAVAERRDSGDRLIDAVICWEALFGGDTELTFKVSASIARLLMPAGPERRKLRNEIAEIYRLRSRIVHGTNIDSSELHGVSRRAVSIAIDVMRVLVAERRDLVSMTSTERATEILMG